MSADNSIVVLRSKGRDGRPEFRVAHITNAENIMYSANPRFRDWFVHSEFGARKVYRNAEAALRRARQLFSAQHYVEYGIVRVNTRRYFPGPTTRY